MYKIKIYLNYCASPVIPQNLFRLFETHYKKSLKNFSYVEFQHVRVNISNHNLVMFMLKRCSLKF